MSAELLIDEYTLRLQPGPIDVHAHPRAFDAKTADNFLPSNEGSEGKAGLGPYTEVALLSGLTAMLAMPNESLRRRAADGPEPTVTIPYPIATRDRLLAMQGLISNQAVIPTGPLFGLDPMEIFHGKTNVLDSHKVHTLFASVTEDCLGLKIYGDETTGGYNVDTVHIPTLTRLWYETNPDKPVIMHLEDDNIGKVLSSIAGMKIGKDVPIHIAHVSSRQELEAVMQAKQQGMNVTCEVTPHHLFLDDSVVSGIGGYGCMKPSLKSREDIEFIWSHLDAVDIFASDCAPHRVSDKQAAKPAYGVTNHTVMLPLLLGAVADGKLTYDDIYRKLCVTPRERFNLPLDQSYLHMDIFEPNMLSAADYEERVGNAYGQNPFKRLDRDFHLVGTVKAVRAGHSVIVEGMEDMRSSYDHLLIPGSLGALAVGETVK
jgi:hypothetical protein